MSLLKYAKGTNTYISQDFPKATRYIRKKLWLSSVEERVNGSKVSLQYNKLFVNGNVYIWDTKTSTRQPILSTRASVAAKATHGTAGPV